MAFYYYLTKEKSFRNEELRDITMQTSAIFSDATIWFGVMAVVAGWIFEDAKARTFYGYSLAIIVAYLFVNSAILTLSLHLNRNGHLGDTQSVVARFIPLFIMYWMEGPIIITCLQRREHMPKQASRMFDTPCYADGFWPLEYLHRATSIEASRFIVILFPCLVAILHFPFVTPRVGVKEYKKYLEEKFGTTIFFGSTIVIMLSFAGMWYDFYAILRIRSRARKGFGQDYEDDAIGYGQIIASGFALQGVVTYLLRTFCEWRKIPYLIEQLSMADIDPPDYQFRKFTQLNLAKATQNASSEELRVLDHDRNP